MMKLPSRALIPILGAWAVFLCLSLGTRLGFHADSLQRLEGTPQPVTLPFHDANRTEPARYRISGEITAQAQSEIMAKNQLTVGAAAKPRRKRPGASATPVARVFHITPDDCLESLSVGGRAVDLRGMSSAVLCNWSHGFSIDLASFLDPSGQTPFTAVIRNISGTVGFDFTAPPEFSITGKELQPLASEPHPVTLPFSNATDPEPMTYLVRGHFSRGPLASTRVRFIPDDCLRELTINEKVVDLSSVRAGNPGSKDALCDWQTGFDIDLAPYLDAREGHFTATIVNSGGPYGLSIASARGNRAQILAWLGRLLLFITFWILLASILPIPRMRAVASLLMAAAIAIRYDVIFHLHPAEAHAFSDAGNYLQHAHDMVMGHYWIGQTFQGIGYPVFLAWAIGLDGGGYAFAHALHLIASALTVWLGWRAAARLLGEKAGLWALLVLTFHFPYIGLSGFFMAETLYGLGIAALFYVLARFSFPWPAPVAFALGLIHMASGTFKGLNSFFPPLLIVWAAGYAWRIGLFSGTRRDPRLIWRRAVRPLFFFIAGAALFGLVQGAFTYRYFGVFQLSAPTGALNLVEGKCPEKLNRDSTGASWLSPLFAQLGETREKRWPRPFTDQAFFWNAGMDCIRANPAVLLTSLRYDYFLFLGNELWPPNMTAFQNLNRRYAMVFAWLLLPGILIGLALSARKPFATRVLPYLPAFSILLCAWALKSEMRYRVPFDCVFIAAGIGGWQWVVSQLGERAGSWRTRIPESAPDVIFGVATLALAIFAGLPIYLASA